ncbi:hypothetical protein N8T08_005594 [Aspergillus melleus]|uniref:Uncharacterized protein n=1 Tax=Aspergillus melleus TaxID=138277 RepID=A0ACC3B2U4_9EURO|nr:hypothetical protein N8T08_005594 [Aspergillus melleus]
MTQKSLTVGILTTQSLTLYIPILQSLPYYQIAIIYDVSNKSAICPKDKATSDSAKTTTSIAQASSPDAVIDHPSVDLVLNFMTPSLREKYTLAALSANKHVLVESPVGVSLPSAHRIIDAQRKSRARVFVASARRYAPCFETFKTEVAGLERIYYARCRNIQGGVAQPSPGVNGYGEPETSASSTSTTLTANDTVPSFPLEATNTFHALLQEAFLGQDLTTERILLSRLLTGPRGCPDLSVMRETLGIPDAVSNIAVNEPFYSAIFHYSGHDQDLLPSTTDNGPTQNRTAYMLTYEYGTDAVPRCDAHLAVYGDGKTVTLEYDGATVRVVIETADEKVPGKVSRRETTSSMEQAYAAELEALYMFLVEGKEVKTTVKDSMGDLRLFREIFEQYDRQCGTIRTPLG